MSIELVSQYRMSSS